MPIAQGARNRLDESHREAARRRGVSLSPITRPRVIERHVDIMAATNADTMTTAAALRETRLRSLSS